MPVNFSNEWLGINPGRLRHTVSIQRASSAQDASGHPSEDWSEIGQIKASIEPLTGVERTTGQQSIADVSHRIVMRYVPGVSSGITPKDRILFGTRIFDLAAVLNLEERNLMLEIMAKERIGGNTDHCQG